VTEGNVTSSFLPHTYYEASLLGKLSDALLLTADIEQCKVEVTVTVLQPG